MKIRESARGKPCLLRVPGVCRGRTETTVHAHLRRAGLGGVGMKPVDVAGIRCCYECHDWLDGRRGRDPEHDEHAETWVLQGLLRTLRALVDEGILPQR